MQKHTFSMQASQLAIELNPDFPYSEFYYENRYHSREQMHTHDCTEIGWCMEGNGLFFIGNEIVPFVPDSISVIRAGTPHIAQSADHAPSKWHFVNVGGEISPPLRDGIVQDRACLWLLRLVVEEFERERKGEARAECRENIDRLISSLLYFYGKLSAKEGMIFSSRYQRILPALNEIALRYGEELKVSELAGLCYLNPNYFRRLFRECTRFSPLQYLTATRLNIACLLLRNSSFSVLEISEKAGFGSLSNFNRLFKHTYGIPPLLYRRAQG